MQTQNYRVLDTIERESERERERERGREREREVRRIYNEFTIELIDLKFTVTAVEKQFNPTQRDIIGGRRGSISIWTSHC
jgi:hypothetical protein